MKVTSKLIDNSIVVGYGITEGDNEIFIDKKELRKSNIISSLANEGYSLKSVNSLELQGNDISEIKSIPAENVSKVVPTGRELSDVELVQFTSEKPERISEGRVKGFILCENLSSNPEVKTFEEVFKRPSEIKIKTREELDEMMISVIEGRRELTPELIFNINRITAPEALYEAGEPVQLISDFVKYKSLIESKLADKYYKFLKEEIGAESISEGDYNKLYFSYGAEGIVTPEEVKNYIANAYDDSRKLGDVKESIHSTDTRFWVSKDDEEVEIEKGEYVSDSTSTLEAQQKRNNNSITRQGVKLHKIFKVKPVEYEVFEEKSIRLAVSKEKAYAVSGSYILDYSPLHISDNKVKDVIPFYKYEEKEMIIDEIFIRNLFSELVAKKDILEESDYQKLINIGYSKHLAMLTVLEENVDNEIVAQTIQDISPEIGVSEGYLKRVVNDYLRRPFGEQPVGEAVSRLIMSDQLHLRFRHEINEITKDELVRNEVYIDFLRGLIGSGKATAEEVIDCLFEKLMQKVQRGSGVEICDINLGGIYTAYEIDMRDAQAINARFVNEYKHQYKESVDYISKVVSVVRYPGYGNGHQAIALLQVEKKKLAKFFDIEKEMADYSSEDYMNQLEQMIVKGDKAARKLASINIMYIKDAYNESSPCSSVSKIVGGMLREYAFLPDDKIAVFNGLRIEVMQDQLEKMYGISPVRTGSFCNIEMKILSSLSKKDDKGFYTTMVLPHEEEFLIGAERPLYLKTLNPVKVKYESYEDIEESNQDILGINFKLYSGLDIIDYLLYEDLDYEFSISELEKSSAISRLKGNVGETVDGDTFNFEDVFDNLGEMEKEDLEEIGMYRVSDGVYLLVTTQGRTYRVDL